MVFCFIKFLFLAKDLLRNWTWIITILIGNEDKRTYCFEENNNKFEQVNKHESRQLHVKVWSQSDWFVADVDKLMKVNKRRCLVKLSKIYIPLIHLYTLKSNLRIEICSNQESKMFSLTLFHYYSLNQVWGFKYRTISQF